MNLVVVMFNDLDLFISWHLFLEFRRNPGDGGRDGGPVVLNDRFDLFKMGGVIFVWRRDGESVGGISAKGRGASSGSGGAPLFGELWGGGAGNWLSLID